MSAPNVRFARTEAVLTRRVGDGILLGSVEEVPFEHLSASGAAVWNALGEQRTVGELARVVAAAFETDAASLEGDVAALVGNLLALGFVREVPGA